jgi:hypothetical protein
MTGVLVDGNVLLDVAAVLPDFYIGARAAVAGYPLLTRDAARYRTYFPRLPVVEP